MSFSQDNRSPHSRDECYFVYSISAEEKRLPFSPQDNEAFEYLKHIGIFPVRISERKLNNELINMKNNIFIVSSLAQDFVEKIALANCVVTTPLTILYYKEHRTPIIRGNIPYFSPCMNQLVISNTGFSSLIRERLFRSIERLGGRPQNRLESSVDVLVCNTVLSEKYRLAIQYNIPIVTPKWVKECFEKYQHELKFANDPAILQTHRIKCFYGLKLCITGVGGRERLDMQAKISANGGKYVGALDKNTDLLVSENKKTEKSKFALNKNIKIVHKKWLFDCIKEDKYLPIVNYSIDFDKLTNTASSPSQSASNFQKQSSVFPTSSSQKSSFPSSDDRNDQKAMNVDEWKKAFEERQLISKRKRSPDKVEQANIHKFPNVTSSSDRDAMDSSSESNCYVPTRESFQDLNARKVPEIFVSSSSSTSFRSSHSQNSEAILNNEDDHIDMSKMDSIPQLYAKDYEREVSRSSSPEKEENNETETFNSESLTTFESEQHFDGVVFLCGFSKARAKELRTLIIQFGGIVPDVSDEVIFREYFQTSSSNLNCFLMLKSLEILPVPGILLSAIACGVMIVKEDLIMDLVRGEQKSFLDYQWILERPSLKQSRKLFSSIIHWKTIIERRIIPGMFDGFHVLIIQNTIAIRKVKNILENAGAKIYNERQFKHIKNKEVFQPNNSFLLFDLKWVMNFADDKSSNWKMFEYFYEKSNILPPKFVEEFILENGNIDHIRKDKIFEQNKLSCDSIQKAFRSKKRRSVF